MRALRGGRRNVVNLLPERPERVMSSLGKEGEAVSLGEQEIWVLGSGEEEGRGLAPSTINPAGISGTHGGVQVGAHRRAQDPRGILQLLLCLAPPLPFLTICPNVIGIWSLLGKDGRISDTLKARVARNKLHFKVDCSVFPASLCQREHYLGERLFFCLGRKISGGPSWVYRDATPRFRPA